MRRTYLLSTVLGTALLATPAMAQRDSIREMQREQGTSTLPAVPAQKRSANLADSMGSGDTMRWLQEAQEALRRNQPGQASEMLERAETRMLSRSLMGTGEQPAHGPAVSHMSAARQALMRRDRTTAMREIDMAMTTARDMPGGMGSDTATGRGAGTMPSQGGGYGYGGMGQPGMPMQPGMSPGSATMRDQGYGGSSMSRADLILAQGGGGGGGGTSSVEHGYPGSPAAGTGSVPQSPGATGAPAVPAAPSEGRGPPVPGTNRQEVPAAGMGPGVTGTTNPPTAPQR